jgi:hypothetical protein
VSTEPVVDLSEYRANVSSDVSSRQQRGAHARKAGAPSRRLYLGGSPPLWWFIESAKLPGACTEVMVALAFEAGVKRTRTVVPSSALLCSMGVSRAAEHRALAAMAHAGLVKLATHRGRRPRVTLLLPEP